MVEDKIEEHRDKKSTNSEDIIDHELITKALSRLNGIISEEERLINQKKYPEATKLIQDKVELVNFFEKHREKILENYVPGKQEDTQKIEDIKKLVQNLLSTSSRNMNNIKKAQYVSDKTMEIIKNIAVKNETKHKNYSKNGNRDGGNKTSKCVLFNTEV